jgi:cardiolipin synthase
LRIGSAVGAAITRPRELGNADGKIMAAVSLLLVLTAIVGVRWPKVLAWPLSAVAVWFAVSFVIRAWRNRRDTRRIRT